MKATTETNAKRNTRQTHRKRTTPTRKFHASHSPTNHTRREPPYRDVPSAARKNLAATPKNLCRGRLGSDLFPFVSLVAFIITTFFLCIDELGELTYFVSGAKDRVLQKQIFSVEYYLSLRSVEIVPKKFDLSVKTRNFLGTISTLRRLR